MSDGWFVQTKETTYWEFSLDGLTEEQAIELDRRIRAVVEAFEAEQRIDGSGAQP